MTCRKSVRSLYCFDFVAKRYIFHECRDLTFRVIFRNKNPPNLNCFADQMFAMFREITFWIDTVGFLFCFFGVDVCFWGGFFVCFGGFFCVVRQGSFVWLAFSQL